MYEEKIQALIDAVLQNCFFRTYENLNVWACTGCGMTGENIPSIHHVDKCRVQLALDLIIPEMYELTASSAHLAYASLTRKESQ